MKGRPLPAHAVGSTLYRQLNDVIRATYRDAGAEDIEVVCECADVTCTALVRVEISAYDDARRADRLLLAHAER